MERVLRLYEENIGVVTFMHSVIKVLRTLPVVIFLLYLSLSCANSTTQWKEYNKVEYSNEIERTATLDDLRVEIPLGLIQRRPINSIPYDYANAAEFPKDTIKDLDKQMHEDESDRICVTDTALAKNEDLKGEENTEGVPVYPVVVLHGNGGFPEITELQLDTYEIDAEAFEVPKRLGKKFDTWYIDSQCTVPFTRLQIGAMNIELYAGWADFKGYVSNDDGMITGYTDWDFVRYSGVLELPTHESCLGVQDKAFSGLEGDVEEVYIPANIVNLPEGIFDDFNNLMFIQVASDNPVYKSINGVLYTIDGTLLCVPQMQKQMGNDGHY